MQLPDAADYSQCPSCAVVVRGLSRRRIAALSCACCGWLYYSKRCAECGRSQKLSLNVSPSEQQLFKKCACGSTALTSEEFFASAASYSATDFQFFFLNVIGEDGIFCCGSVLSRTCMEPYAVQNVTRNVLHFCLGISIPVFVIEDEAYFRYFAESDDYAADASRYLSITCLALEGDEEFECERLEARYKALRMRE